MSREPEQIIMHGTIVVRNSQPAKIRLVVEPWGNEYGLLPGETLEIAYSGPSGGQLEVESKPGEIILYGWVGSILDVKDGTNPPPPSPVPPTPPMPPGA